MDNNIETLKRELVANPGDANLAARLQAAQLRAGAAEGKPARITLANTDIFARRFLPAHEKMPRNVEFVRMPDGSEMGLRSYWDGGRRDYWYHADENGIMRALDCPGAPPFDTHVDRQFIVTDKYWLVKFTFAGTTQYATIYVPDTCWAAVPFNVADIVALDTIQTFVLYCHRAYKRPKQEALTKMSEYAYSTTVDALVTLGCMARKGRGYSVTPKGRMATQDIYGMHDIKGL